MEGEEASQPCLQPAIREQNPRHGKHVADTVLKGGLKSKWAIGGDLPGYVEVRPRKFKQKPKIVQPSSGR